MVSGRILHLQRFSTEDGPGIRTTVFFKGCSLRCSWCHNPESLQPQVQLQWYSDRCLDCRTCLDACPNGCLEMGDSGLLIDRQCCQGCATCAQACPANAIEALGRQVSAVELLDELQKDRAYYDTSGGGVTLSGGEPSLQPDFASELLSGLKIRGIHTALDTCGLSSPRVLERLLPSTDLVLYDLKLFDPIEHERFTGQSNQLIIENLLFVQEFIHSQPKPVDLWIRTPLIPGATDTDENILAIGEFIQGKLNGTISRWDLCAFNNLCQDKYKRLDLEWDYAGVPLMTRESLLHCEEIARTSVEAPEIVCLTGAARVNHPSQEMI